MSRHEVDQARLLPSRDPWSTRPSAEDRIVLPRSSPVPPPVPADVRVPRYDGLVRPRLVAALDRVLAMRVCTVVAPPGCGKTTAVAHWAGRLSVEVSWCRVDPPAEDPVDQLLRTLGGALRPVVPRLPARPSFDELVATLGGRSEPLVIVLDDFQHLATGEVGAVLERFLLSTPAGVHLVIGSRVAPALNLARSELSSSVVGPGDLRFRPVEVSDLFRSVFRLPLAADDARELVARTEGWAAALELFHQDVAGRAGRARRGTLAGLTATPRYARDYLVRSFLSPLEPEESRFLRETAVFEVLGGAPCDRLLGRADSADVLARLADRGIIAVAEDGPGYVIPRVLRDHLLSDLVIEHGRREVERRHRSAAQILSDVLDDALPSSAPAAARAWASGGAWPDALAVLADAWCDVLSDPALAWIDAAPPQIAGHPLVRTARAELARRDGRLTDALDLLASGPRASEPEAADAAASIERFCRMWTVGDLQPEQRWMEQLRSAVRRPDPDRRSTLPRAEHVAMAAIETLIAGDLCGARIAVARLQGQVAEPLLDCVFRLLAAVLDPAGSITAEETAILAEDLGIPWLARIANGVARYQDPEVVAAEVNVADQRGDAWGALLFAAAGGLADLQAGRPAVRPFEDVVRRCRELDAPALEAWARSGLALAAVAAGLPDAGRDADSAVGFAFSAQVPGALALARLALATCRGDAQRQQVAVDDVRRLGLDPCVLGVAVVGTPAARTRPVEPPVAVRCFGGYDLRIDGAAPDLTGVRPRARAVLRLLSLHAGRPIHREVITEAMWPQLDQGPALHNLHVCVSGLRTALEPGVARGASRLIVRDGDRYRLALPDGATSDLRDFDTAVAAADTARAGGDPECAIRELVRALSLYGGEVLPEDGPTEWVLPVREHFQSRAAAIAARLGRLHLELRRPEEAVAAARRAIDIDPFRDGSWRLLIAAHDAAGNMVGAEESRRSYADVLASLGVASTAATSVTRGR